MGAPRARQADPLRRAPLPLDLRGRSSACTGRCARTARASSGSSLASHAFYGCFFIGNPLEFFPKLLAGAFGELPVGWWFPALLWFSTLLDYRVGPRHRGRAQPARAARLAPREPRREPRRARLLQVLRLLRRERPRGSSPGSASTPRWEPLRIFLPYGISFYTFQSLSYSIDVYRGRLPAERSFLNLAFFIAFFPQLDRRPDRARDDLPAADPRARGASRPSTCAAARRSSSSASSRRPCVADGARRLRRRGTSPRPRSYDAAERLGGGALLRRADLLRLQRLHRHGDRRRAAARLRALPELRLPLPEPEPRGVLAALAHQPAAPGCATTSTSRSAATAARALLTCANLMLTMLLGGLWHGAGWNFVAWGGLHGLALVAQRAWERRAPALGHAAMRCAGRARSPSPSWCSPSSRFA